MVVEGDFEMAMEDELSDSGTEASTDVEIYGLESEEETDETEEETDESEEETDETEEETDESEEEEAEAKAKESAKVGICGLVGSKPNRLKAHVMSHQGGKIGTSDERDKLLEKKTPEDCKILESEQKKSRKVENNGCKPREIRRYRCQICGVIRAKRSRLKDHIMLHRGVKKNIAEIDELIEKKNPEDCEAKKWRKVENNGFKVRELRRYCCTLCGLVRSKRKFLENHIILEHSGELNTKDEVDKFIEKKRPEDDQRRYSCQICGVLRSKRVLLELHMRSSHGPEALKSDNRFASEVPNKHSPCVCNMCGMSFRKPAHLQQHKTSHTALEGLRHLALLSTRWETALEELGC